MKSLKQLMDLSGRKALVTGGAGHVGLAICESLLELGATVTITDLDLKACDARKAELAGNYAADRIHVMPADLGDESQVRKMVRDSIQRMGGLDILVHSAAYVGTTKVSGWAVPFESQTLSAFESAMKVNVGAAFAATQEAREALASGGHGSVIFISSIYGLVGPDMRLYEGTSMANPAGYAASKGGLLQLNRYLASVLAPGIRINSITPGGIERAQPAEFQERYVARTPLNRMATEEDIKGAVAYLAGDLSAYVTGQNIIVDGGWTAW